eukprot:scaffold99103_cov30-Tisochrysis_lutea.AAC.2
MDLGIARVEDVGECLLHGLARRSSRLEAARLEHVARLEHRCLKAEHSSLCRQRRAANELDLIRRVWRGWALGGLPETARVQLRPIAVRLTSLPRRRPNRLSSTRLLHCLKPRPPR